MARISLFQSAALAALAAAAAFAVPAQAQDLGAGANAQVRVAAANDPDGGEGRHGGWRNRDGGGQAAPSASDHNWRGGGDGDQRTQARAEWRQRAEVQQQAPQQRSAPEGGWGSQRPAEGQRYGRDWSNGGVVNRPAPAWRGAAPAVPDRGTAEQTRRYDRSGATSEWSRNRTYSDPNRSTTYRGDRDRSAETWRERQADRSSTYRDGYRDGRTVDSYRDRRDQTQTYRQGYDGSYRSGYTSGSRDWSRNRTSGDYRRWDRDDWRRDSRYNWYGYRTQHRDLYRAGRYYSPYRNWSYNRLSIGFFLEPLFFSRNYWIDDPWQYRLPQVYGPYRWVRYYDDVLLVDIYSGEVVDVIHDFFW